MSKNRLFYFLVAIALVTVVALTAWRASTIKVIANRSDDLIEQVGAGKPASSNPYLLTGQANAQKWLSEQSSNASVNAPFHRGEWYCTYSSFGQPICRK